MKPWKCDYNKNKTNKTAIIIKFLNNIIIPALLKCTYC